MKRAVTSAVRTAPCADHDVLDGDEGDEQNESDDVVAAHHELSESLDDASGGAGAFVAVEKNAAAGGEVERQAEEGEQKQQAGKNGKLRRAQDLQGGEQNQYGSGKAGGEQEIERERRQRHQHDEDQADGRDGDDPFDELVACEWPGDDGGGQASAASSACGSGSGAGLRAVDGGQDFGNGGIEFRGHRFVPLRRCGRGRERAADSRPWECFPSARFP